MTEPSLEENSTQARKQPAVNLKDTKLSRALIKAEFIYCCKMRCQVWAVIFTLIQVLIGYRVHLNLSLFMRNN